MIDQTGHKSLEELLINIGLGNTLSIGIARRLKDEFTEESSHYQALFKN